MAYWQEYADSPNALTLAGSVVGALPTVDNPIKLVPLTTVASVANLACALAAAGSGRVANTWHSA